MTTNETRDVRTHTVARFRWNWGWGIAAVYTVFASATIAFAVFSFTQNVELVTPDYYERELTYDGHARRIHNTSVLGADVRVHADAATHVLTLRFPLTVSSGSVLLYRPSASGLDRRYAVSCDADSVMRIDVRDLLHGEWRVQVTWDSGATPLYHESVVNL
ncbi:MAG: FixH family protein [Candidatus Kapaibacterium sp.]